MVGVHAMLLSNTRPIYLQEICSSDFINRHRPTSVDCPQPRSFQNNYKKSLLCWRKQPSSMFFALSSRSADNVSQSVLSNFPISRSRARLKKRSPGHYPPSAPSSTISLHTTTLNLLGIEDCELVNLRTSLYSTVTSSEF